MGLLHTYQTGQTLAPLGGGDPTGLPLGPYANWAALPASGVDGALALVSSLGAGNAYGIAAYDGSASEWALYMGWFDTVADMTAFSEPITTGALASVEASADNNENGVRYQYEGSWTRTAALTAGFAWSLTVTQVLTGADPSGIGLVRDGDYGVFAGSQGPVVLRYKAFCTRAAAAGGGTIARWMTPDAYAGTPIVQAYSDGTESNATLAAQGWTLVLDTGCLVTATAGYQRLSSPATATTARLRAMVGTVTAALRVEHICEVRTNVSGAFQLAVPLYVLDGTNATAFRQAANAGVGFGDLTNTSAPAMAPALNGAYANLPTLVSTPAFCVIRDRGATVSDTADVNGEMTGFYRRASQATSANLLQVSVAGAASGGPSMDYRGQIITY